MKKTTKLRIQHPRIVVFLALCTVALTFVDLGVHHHSVTALLPEWGMFVVLSLAGGIVFMVVALCVRSIISRKGDYYER